MEIFVPATPIGRFAAVVETFCRGVAAQAAKDAGLCAMLCLLWSRLSRIKMRVAHLAARIPEGAPPKPHRVFAADSAFRCAARRRATQPRAAQHNTAQNGWKNLPRRFGWALRIAPAAIAAKSQLRHLLAEPDTAALVAASPGIRRQLRPLCRMLGLDPPASPPPLAEPPPPEAPPQRETSPQPGPWAEPPSPPGQKAAETTCPDPRPPEPPRPHLIR